MSRPVTRGELRGELAKFEERFEKKLDAKLKLWAGALNGRIERGEQRMIAHVSAEIARCTNAILEAVRVQIVALDDKYKDLPRRVARLERRVKLKG